MSSQAPQATNVKQTILAKVKEHYPNAGNIVFYPVVDKFLRGPIYYAEWEEPGAAPSDCFCYVFYDKEPELYDDGIQVIQRMKQVLDERRTIWTHIGEFTFNDLVGAVIALIVIGLFCWNVGRKGTPDKELLSILLLIAGYYFGKSTRG